MHWLALMIHSLALQSVMSAAAACAHRMHRGGSSKCWLAVNCMWGMLLTGPPSIVAQSLRIHLAPTLQAEDECEMDEVDDLCVTGNASPPPAHRHAQGKLLQPPAAAVPGSQAAATC